MFGVMIDCSRNAVMNIETLKLFSRIIKKMGYDTLLLYMEDAYEIESHPYFGHLRGRYTKQEIQYFDEYCSHIGIELVPCIQTLAHLDTMFKWRNEYSEVNDCDNILLVGEDKTYKLIEAMIASVAECFSSRKIHIGMDEAYHIGAGQYQAKNGIRNSLDIMNEHLHKVCDITGRYGFKPMIWSDMLCKPAAKTHVSLPADISLVYWDYYSRDYDHYAELINENRKFERPVIYAGGAWTWDGMAPKNTFSMQTMSPSIAACKNCGIDNIFFTLWGDDGSECSKFSVLPALCFAAQCFKGDAGIERTKEKFEEITGCDFDSFMLLDRLHRTCGEIEKVPKRFLYNDLFMGMFDYYCSADDSRYYSVLAKELKKHKNQGDFSYIFDYYEKLASVLAVKADIGVRTRASYLKKDMEELKTIANDYDRLSILLEDFYSSFRNLWFKENKPHGFDVQDIRLGGMFRRIHSCRSRIEQLISGEISEIAELDEPVLPDGNNTFAMWRRLITPNYI